MCDIKNHPTFQSQMEARHNKDCMACRIASGSGIIGLGIYLFVQSRKLLRKPVQRGIIGTMAAGENSLEFTLHKYI